MTEKLLVSETAVGRVELKNRWLAGALALLVPGLGHLYQGRNFKAGIYCVAILGLFFTGQALGEWKVVYLANGASSGRLEMGRRVEIVGRLLQGYVAQFPVGVAAWPAIIQSQRYADRDNRGDLALDGPLSGHFLGGIWIDNAHERPVPLATLEGTVTLEERGRILVGHFRGTTLEGHEVSFELSRIVDLGREVSSAPLRPVEAVLNPVPQWVEIPKDDPLIPADADVYFKGGIERPFWDWYQVPLGNEGVDRLIDRLGASVEIAWVFTWIAGLLNVLAIWDAFDGPAYGYGTEKEFQGKRRDNGDSKDSQGVKGENSPPAAVAGEPIGRASG